MGRTLACALVLAACLLTVAPAGAGTSSEIRAVILRTEQLRGLRTTHPLAVTTLDAAGMRRLVRREVAGEREPRSDAAWNDALHLLEVLRPGQSLEAVRASSLAGQVAGLYVPGSGRLYVLGSGGSAPRSVIAHEVTHALQDQHFGLTHGAFAPHPLDHDGELAALALVEGDATDVQSRYVATLSPGQLVSELARTLSAMPRASPSSAPAFLQRELIYPYSAGEAFVQALRARGGQRLLDRAFRRPPRTTAAVLDPARYLAGDPAPLPVQLPAGSSFSTTFGAEDLVALTGQDGLARDWLGGRLGVGPRGVDLRLATRSAALVAAALGRVLPRAAAIVFHGRLVCVRVARNNASVRGLRCR